MEYKFLHRWVKEAGQKNLQFKSFLKFRDQYIITFKKTHLYLQINLASENSFCFFSEKKYLPFEERNELNKFNLHLASSRLTNIEISKNDRILSVTFSKIDIYNQITDYKLILEIVPRYQNIILTKQGEIVDCLKKVSFAENRHRQILPGSEYESPSTDFVAKKEDVKFPLKIVSAKKINEATGDGFDSVNLLFESLYYNFIFASVNNIEKNKAAKKLQSGISKKQKKIQKLETELQDAGKEENFKQTAELLKANFASLMSGMESVKLKDYYAEGFPEIEIKLDVTKHPKQNVEFYFKKYRKARDGKVKIAEQIRKTHDEIDELEKQVFELEETDLYLPGEKQKLAKHKKTEHRKRLKINEDWEILVGRTSKENDLLTTKIAKSNDWWFHTRVFRGTHIILRNFNKKDLPDNIKLICCRLAAYYSKAKTSSNVPVDFTQIKYVRKPRGSAPGFVTYKNQNTIYVDPVDFRDAAKKLKGEYPISNKE